MRLRVRGVAALVALALLSACAGDSDVAAPGDDPVVTDGDGVPATVPADGSTTSQAPAAADGSSSGGGSSPGPTAAPAPTSTGEPGPAPAPPAPGAVGSFAPYYLRPAESASILVDVHSQAGAEPRAATLGHLASVLGDVSGKPVDTTQAALGGAGRQWTAADIRALADSVAPAQSRDRAVLTLLYLRGGFAENENALGVAVRSDVAAVFSDKVDDAAGVLADPAAIEDAVSLHEVGHLLGLVDLYLQTGRQDPDHPGHSPNRESVMYYAVESTLIGTILEGGPPREFDQADRQDLAQIRNG